MSNADILVIDENEHIAKLFRNIYKEFDTPVDTANGCCAGISKIVIQTYDLVFLEANLGNITGFELLKLIKGLNKQTKVVIMSAHIEKSVIESHTDIRADAYLEKPISIFDILSITARLIEDQGLKNRLKEQYRL